MPANDIVKTTIDAIKHSKYLIVRPNPASGLVEVLAFDTKMEVEGYLNGCSNPEDCVPAARLALDVLYKLKCKKLV